MGREGDSSPATHVVAQVVHQQEVDAPPPLAPRTIAETLAPPVLEPPVEAQPVKQEVNLTEALALAAGDSPEVRFAAARYREAYAQHAQAKALWLPSLRAGVSFNHHDGTLQASDGNALVVSRSSLQAGLGAQAVGAGTPAVPGVFMNFHASDALFGPKATAHRASAEQAATRAVTNDTLLATALAYLNFLRAVEERAVAEETLDNAKALADLTDSFARNGQGPQADADRTKTELVRRRNAVARADEAVLVASARLAELLRLDPQIPIEPREMSIVPVDLIDRTVPLGDLIPTGLANRPELVEAQHLVCEAVYRYRREKYAPFVPSVLLGISQGGFGGGTGSSVGSVRNRFDLDGAAFWEIRNLGLGESARRDATRARYDQSRALHIQTMDRITREIAEAHAQLTSRHGQIATAELGVKSATESYRRNLQRIREGQGLPIEVLQSLQSLDDARREYLRTLVDYNEAQFRLQRALGWPIR